MALSLSVLLLSASILSFEIIVIRLLAISHWQPFVTLAISTALLGYGLSGSILGRFQDRIFPYRHIFYPALAAGATLLYRPVIHASGRLHLDPGLIIRDPLQWFKVALLIGVLTIPFTLASGALALPLLERRSVGKYYGWNFIGAALGVLVLLPALGIIGPSDLPRIPTLFAGLAVLVSLVHFNQGKKTWNTAVAGIVFLALWYPSPSIIYGPYKDISYSLKLPSAMVKAERSGVTGRFQVVTAPAIRSAAGLSTRYQGELPGQAAVYLGGDRIGTLLLAGSSHDEDLDYLRWQTAAAPYTLLEEGARIIIAGFDGGEEAARAIYFGSSVTLMIEPDKAIKTLIRGHTDLFRRWIFGPDASNIVSDSVRSHLSLKPAQYDLIVYPSSANLAAAAAGLTGTTESYEITVQGMIAALRNIDRQGMVAITGWNRFPPTGRWKILGLFSRINTLKKDGRFGGRVYLITGWSTHTFLIRARPFSPAELGKLNAFCNETGFTLTDADRIPGPEEMGPAGGENITLNDLDLRPPTDSRPYPWHSLRFSYLKHLVGQTREAAFPRIEWGFFFLIMVLAVTTFFALVALFLSRPRRGSSGGFSFGIYFACLGTGYMTTEILLIKRCGLVMGPPAVTAAVVLTSFMLCSGLGSHIAGKVTISGWTSRWVFPGIVLLTGIAYILIPFLLSFSAPVRMAALFLVAAPTAFLMGFPFPSALMLYETNRESLVSWAWALNGYTSVIGSSLAGVLAVTTGFGGLFMLGSACYLAAGWMYISMQGA